MQKEVIGDATLYLGDCLDVLPLMTKGDADLLLTDPPYGVEFVGRAGVHEVLHNDHKGFGSASV